MTASAPSRRRIAPARKKRTEALRGGRDVRGTPPRPPNRLRFFLPGVSGVRKVKHGLPMEAVGALWSPWVAYSRTHGDRSAPTATAAHSRRPQRTHGDRLLQALFS